MGSCTSLVTTADYGTLPLKHYGCNLSGVRLHKTLSKRWYWEGMYGDCISHCPQCGISQGTGKKIVPPLNPILIDYSFKIVGVDIMELPETKSGNK